MTSSTITESDRQLLERYVAEADEDAFAKLVRRHGPMVLGVCRQILHQETDAEDAFQATFLVLARKASAVHWQESVGSWLYEVASRIALRGRALDRRRPLPATEEGAMSNADPVSHVPMSLRQYACLTLLPDTGRGQIRPLSFGRGGPLCARTRQSELSTSRSSARRYGLARTASTPAVRATAGSMAAPHTLTTYPVTTNSTRGRQ